MRGLIDHVGHRRIQGWVFDLHSQEVVSVSVELGGRVIASGIANLPRLDVERTHKRVNTGFEVITDALANIRASIVLSDLKVIAEGNFGRRELAMWVRLREKLEAQARIEDLEARRTTLEEEEALAYLRNCLSALDIRRETDLDKLVGSLTSVSPSHPEIRTCDAFNAYWRREYALCCDILSNEVLDMLAASDPTLAAKASDLRVRAAYANSDIAAAGYFLGHAVDRGWHVDDRIASAVTDRLTDTRKAEPRFALKDKYTLVLTDQFKWMPENFPHWGSVFMGTTDAPVDSLDRIVEFIGSIPETKRHLVAIVGGMWFLRLLSRLRFARITVFDTNVMELAKMAYARDIIVETDHGDFDGFRNLDGMIRRGFRDFYLPKSMDGFDIVRNNFSFSYDGRVSPIDTIISPLDYPSLTWNPDKDEYDMARENLKRGFDRSLHLRMPPVESGMFGVAYLSHVEFPHDVLVENLKTRHFIPIYARNTKNTAALDPHVYWDWHSINLAGGMRTVHLRAPEDRSLKGGVHAGIYSLEATFDEFVGEMSFQHGGCLILPMYLSKGHDQSPTDRRAMVVQVLRRASSRYDRIIVSEWANFGLDILTLTREQLASDFDLVDGPVYSPGKDDTRRSVFYVFHRSTGS